MLLLSVLPLYIHSPVLQLYEALSCVILLLHQSCFTPIKYSRTAVARTPQEIWSCLYLTYIIHCRSIYQCCTVNTAVCTSFHSPPLTKPVLSGCRSKGFTWRYSSSSRVPLSPFLLWLPVLPSAFGCGDAANFPCSLRI